MWNVRNYFKYICAGFHKHNKYDLQKTKTWNGNIIQNLLIHHTRLKTHLTAFLQTLSLKTQCALIHKTEINSKHVKTNKNILTTEIIPVTNVTAMSLCSMFPFQDPTPLCWTSSCSTELHGRSECFRTPSVCFSLHICTQASVWYCSLYAS